MLDFLRRVWRSLGSRPTRQNGEEMYRMPASTCEETFRLGPEHTEAKKAAEKTLREMQMTLRMLRDEQRLVDGDFRDAS